MKVVRTSELFKMLSIPSLGEYSNGSKLRDGIEPYFVKENGKYVCRDKQMNYGMVLEYVGDNWVVQLSNSEDFENIYLAAIFVKDKGKGIGSELMNKILDYCDENGYKLYLHPFPLEYTKDRFNPKKALPLFYKLKDWYKSFDMIEEENGYMVYYPQK